jgi:ABC-type antimicrobial peptide transport system permease subunit
MIAISSVVLFMFGLVAASTIAQSVRERTSELAVLKTLGFTGGAILALVLAESLFIALAGGGLGLALAGCSCSKAIRLAACCRSSCWRRETSRSVSP